MGAHKNWNTAEVLEVMYRKHNQYRIKTDVRVWCLVFPNRDLGYNNTR